MIIINKNKVEWPLSKKEMKHFYCRKRLLQKEIAELFNKSVDSVQYWMKKYNINGRHNSEYKRKTQEKFESEVKELVGGEYKVLGNYKNAKTKIKMKHMVCNNEYKITPDEFLSGSGCPYCANRRRTPESFREEIKENTNGEYEVLGDYVNAKTKLEIKHKKCGNVYETTPNHFLNGRRCNDCYLNNLRKTNNEFQKEVYEMVGDEYTFLEKYKLDHIKLKVKHNKCGFVYKVTPSSFLQGKKCPKCSKLGISSGEKIVEDFLIKNNVEYKWQYSYEDCKNINVLPFDFKIKNKPIVIEYNGKQHYEPIKYFGGEDELKYRKKNDEIKRNYCKDHNIKLIEIPYWNKNKINNILYNELDMGMKNKIEILRK